MTEKDPLPTMEIQQTALEKSAAVPASGTPPSFFVILPPSKGIDKLEQGILVSDRDVGSVSSSTPRSVAAPGKLKAKCSLPADCKISGVTVVLDNNTMWNEFYRRNTEMILTKQGRRMFPYCRYWITGLDPYVKYILVMDITPVDNQRYKWNGRWWETGGKAEPHVLGRVFIHPESPSSGQYWMHQPVSFYKLKLTNNYLDQEGHIILHSMHRYLPRLHMVPADQATEVIQLNGPDVLTFTFPQTEFFAVTAYQNIQITQLKIDYNPFAKGFREDALSPKPLKDILVKARSVLEGASRSVSPGTFGNEENEWLDHLKKGQGALGVSQDPVDSDVERDSFNAERDFLDFLNPELSVGSGKKMKEEILDSLDDDSRVTSLLKPSRSINVIIKEEPVDEYGYGKNVSTDAVVVKQEESEDEEDTDEYSNSDEDYPILERQLMKQSAMDKASDYRSHKRPRKCPSREVKAKMLKLDSRDLPDINLKHSLKNRDFLKGLELEDHVSSCRQERTPDNKESLDSSADKCSMSTNSTNETIERKKTVSESIKEKEGPFPEKPAVQNSETFQRFGDSEASCLIPKYPDRVYGRKKYVPALEHGNNLKDIAVNQPTKSVSPVRRGRPRKYGKVGRPPKKVFGKQLKESDKNNLKRDGPFANANLDCEDVDGVLFVSFVSKEALDTHFVNRPVGGKAPKSLQTPSPPIEEAVNLNYVEKEHLEDLTVQRHKPVIHPALQEGDLVKINELENMLLEDLKSQRHKQVIHPALQEVGLKLGVVDPTVSIDLRYLGVQLPLAYFTSSTTSNSNLPDTGNPFISRTGKTNDFTKIKGWRDKFSTNTSSSEGGIAGGPMKNRSAFCSDKLDEYLENEAKLIVADLEPSPSLVLPPVNYQLPTKSTSYVRTLDSVLKKQSTPSMFSNSPFKPFTSMLDRKKPRARNKPTLANTKPKRGYRRILPSPFIAKQSVPAKVFKSQPINPPSSLLDSLMMPALDENMLPKQANIASAQQQQNSLRLPVMSKSHTKLMDLEECAVWDGRPRTYITEERADISLVTLLTAQASLKSKPVQKIIRKRAPACNNEFCRLGCVCASISQEKRQPTHCRRPECLFGCTCLKRKMMLVKGGLKQKSISKNAVDGGPVSESAGDELQLPLGDQEGESEEEENPIEGEHQIKKVKLEYAICKTEPEEPIRKVFSIWERGANDEDPEPICIPKSSIREFHKSETPPLLEVPSSMRGKPGRAYTPRPNPVMRDEDKDPVYLYFESMMTCARVRTYDRKSKGYIQDEQLELCTCNSKHCNAKKHHPELLQMDTSNQVDKEEEKHTETRWSLSHRKSDTSTSFVHKIGSGGPTKLIEIISDCNWEEDRDKILNILSKQINRNMPRSLKVGNFIVELGSENRTPDEKQPPFISSRVKISMPACQDKNVHAEMLDSETSDFVSLFPRSTKADASDRFQEKSYGCKGLPFYTGLCPAGKLIANKLEPESNPSGLIEVNGKSYPQAKLLLGQMGALHPANRLAAYITGRLRPTVLDLSTLTSVISKVSSSAKTSTLTTIAPSVTRPSVTSSNTAAAARTPAKDVFTQFMLKKVGTLQQKAPILCTPQTLSGTQKFSISPTSIMLVTPVTGQSCQVFTTTPSTVLSTLTTPSFAFSAATSTATTSGIKDKTGKVASPATTPTTIPANKEITPTSKGNLSSPTFFAVTASQTITTISQTTVTSSLTTTATTKATVVKLPTTPVTPLSALSFARTLISTSTIPLPVTTTMSSVLSATKAKSLVTTSPSSSSGSTLSSTPILLTGLSSVSQKQGAVPQASVTSPPVLSPGTERRIGPRLLLIPVSSSTPAVRPASNVLFTQKQKMVLQPFRNPGGVNLFRHPNGQIIQLVPLQQVRPAGGQPNAQPLVLRNPGSVMGIQLPLPTKIPSTSTPISASTSLGLSTSHVVSTTVASVLSSSTLNTVTLSTTSASSVPTFMSQAGTLTLRIAPPTASSLAPGQTSLNSKLITYSSAGQPVGAASLVPLQSGSFALLQLPGQKTVPTSILSHAASLQLQKDTETTSQKDQQGPEKQCQGDTLTPDVLVSTPLENTFPENISNSRDKFAASEAASSAIILHESTSEVLCDSGISPKNHSQSQLSKKIILANETGLPESLTKQNMSEKEKENLETDTEKKGSLHPHEVKSALKAAEEQKSVIEPERSGEKNRTQTKNGCNNDMCVQSLCETNDEKTDESVKNNEQVCDDAIPLSAKQQGQENKVVLLTTKAYDQCVASAPVARTLQFVQTNSVLNPRKDLTGNQVKSLARDSNLQSSKALLAENMDTKREISCKVEEAVKDFDQQSVLNEKVESGELKKTLVLINLDDEDDDNEEEDDKSDDSADMLDDAQSDEEELNADMEVDEPLVIREDEEQIDIETVEELSEKINIARLKAKATRFGSQLVCNIHNEKGTEIDMKLSTWKKRSRTQEPFKFYRQAHTASERRRRHEMRDLFEKLKKMLGLHLPKVSKCYILSQAYNEIQGLTDQADKLIGQKNLLTRKQDLLIRKVSTLSGKPEEVVLKKLEYIYAKQKASDVERKKRQMGEDELAQQLRPSRLLKKKSSPDSFTGVEQLTMTTEKRSKPLILARRPQPIASAAQESLKPTLNLSGGSLMMTPQGQIISLKNSFLPGQLTSVPSTIFQADLSSQAACKTSTAQPGITSMMIQLPGSSVPIQLNGIISSSSVPVALSTATNTPVISTVTNIAVEKEDIFMMPKIVNVTSLAQEPEIRVDLKVAQPPTASTVAKVLDKTTRREAKVNDNSVLEIVTPVASKDVTEHRGMGNSSIGSRHATISLSNRDPSSTQVLNVPGTKNVAEHDLPDRRIHVSVQRQKAETNVESEQIKVKPPLFHKLLNKNSKDSRIAMELKHVSSAMEETALHSSELMSDTEEQDETDETLTSLLNEIAFLNQQLNDDVPSLPVGQGLPESRRGRNEITAGGASSTQYDLIKQFSDVSGNKSPISPLLLQLEESELQTDEKHFGPSLRDQDTLNVAASSIKKSLQSNDKEHFKSSSRFDSASVSPPPILQKKAKAEVGSTDTLWRPMPKLAPLGLKVSHLTSDQDGQSTKVMPPLAPVRTKLGPLWIKVALPATEQEGQLGKSVPPLSAKETTGNALLQSSTIDKLH